MAIHYDSQVTHWNYFLALEEDFGQVARYVEPCRDNEGTYSIEFSRLLMAASQEVDVVLKALCAMLEPGSHANSINGYFTVINSNLPGLLSEEVRLPRYHLRSIPWSNWASGTPPHWWTANNKIKHHRHSDFNQATLKNTYNALAALYVLIAYWKRQELLQVLGTDPTTFHWVSATSHLESRTGLFMMNDDYYYKPIMGI